jgi:hypothetical protein
MTAAAALSCCIATVAFAEHAYIDYDADENMVISGPFNAIIPKPEGARIGGPEHSKATFMGEDLKISKAGYFGDDQFVVVQVETTNAPAGTLTNKNLLAYEIAGEVFRARKLCVDISQDELNEADDPLFEFIELQMVQIVPAVQSLQLFVTTEDGTGEGIILYVRNVPGGCDALTPEFEAEFNAAFERFVESIQNANPEN